MYRRILPIIIIGLLLPVYLLGKTILLSDKKLPDKFERKVHPLEKYFNFPNDFDHSKRNSNKLLTILVDFPLDDNPETTGDGSFQDSLDAVDYPVTWAKPPHDYNYFVEVMEALKYYYKAASFENFILEYDVFPKPDNGRGINAYTLPNEMAYYNPPGAESYLMVERFEEYFLDSFMAADEDDSIDFSDYSHFMLVHAGSDWQHDIFGDTPSDIPSFFIKILEDDKKAVVHDGSDGTEVIIDHACNVPETVTQDVYEIENGNTTEHYGYGLLNAVAAHEFGHSVGFVDLYNTRTFKPEVGYYDIMDSGGFGLAGYGFDDNNDNIPEEVYYFEGGFPVFPGAWSRMLAWEDEFRQMGILRDISQLDLSEPIEVLPIAKKYNQFQTDPRIIKVPINDDEYYLIENRQVDPDGDGGLIPVMSEDERVVLYPTYNDTLNSHFPDPTYEYDYMLPGWKDRSGNEIGGGLLIWHIDESRIYANDNFENNQVNTLHTLRGVRIIEADNIQDIGSQYSFFWRGTEYEPFFKYMPKFDDTGFFTGWDNQVLPNQGFVGEIHNDSLSATTKPAFVSNNESPSVFAIYDISSYPVNYGEERIMSFRFGSQLFDATEKLAASDSLKAIGQVGYSFTTFPTIPIVDNNFQVDLYTKIGENWNIFSDFWGDYGGIDIPISGDVTQSIMSNDVIADIYNDDENLVVCSNKIHYIAPENSQQNPPQTITFSSPITSSPMYLEDFSKLIVPTENKLFIGSDSLAISSAKPAYDKEKLVALSGSRLYYIDLQDNEIQEEIELPEDTGNYDPICYTDPQNSLIFIQSEAGNMYRVQDRSVQKIFDIYPYSDKKPSQLGLVELNNDGQVFLVFGVGDRVFAITFEGTNATGFPAYLEYKEIVAESYPYIIEFDNQPYIILEEKDQGFIAVNKDAEIALEYSFFWDKSNFKDQFYWDEEYERLYFIYADNNAAYASHINDIAENPLIWNGFRNSQYSFYENAEIFAPAITVNGLSAFAYPNPAKKGESRIRISNAEANIDLKIFDIAGNMIVHRSIEKENSGFQDIKWDTRNISSGLYFGIVKSAGNITRLKIAIEN